MSYIRVYFSEWLVLYRSSAPTWLSLHSYKGVLHSNICLTGPSKVTDVCVTKSEEEDGTLTMNVSWTTPQSDLPITEYEVEYKTSGMKSWINATHHSVMPPANYTALTGLDVATEYRIRVRALSVIGTGEWSDEQMDKSELGMVLRMVTVLCVWKCITTLSPTTIPE